MTDHSKWERYTGVRRYDAGQSIFKQGDPADEMYIVDNGEVVIAKEIGDDEVFVLGFRDPGQMIGEIALITDAPRTASITAVDAVTLRVLSRADFWALMRSDEEFQRVVMQTVIERLLAADESRITAELWERDLHERFSHLTDEHEQLAEVVKLRQETMQFIVHDLHNPLGLARTALNMVEMAPDYDSGSEMGRFVMMAKGSVQRMLNMVDSLLDIERLGEGEAALTLEDVDIVALMEATIVEQESIARTLSVQLIPRLPQSDSLSLVQIDRDRIERVITNLLDNAMKFTPPDGQVTLSLERTGDILLIAVNDTGSGIPAEQRERIFERFAHVEGSGNEVTSAGLGLSFCRSAVAAHGGEIRAEEGDDGVGTKMVFTLPLTR